MYRKLSLLFSFIIILLLHYIFLNKDIKFYGKESKTLKKRVVKIKIKPIKTQYKKRQNIADPQKKPTKVLKQEKQKTIKKSDTIKTTTKKLKNNKTKTQPKPNKKKDKEKAKQKESINNKSKIKKNLKRAKKQIKKHTKKKQKIGDELNLDNIKIENYDLEKKMQKKSLSQIIQSDIKDAALGDRDVENGMSHPWFEELRLAVMKQQVYNAKLKRIRLSGSVVVGFTVLSDGSFTNIAIYRSSGSKMLNALALETFSTMAKFKPIPKELHKQRINLWMSLIYERR